MKIYLVGGAVRDKLLGIEPHEFDWVVVGSSVAEMERLGYQQVGKDFPVFLHPQTKEEYALARTERKSGTGYSGFKVSFDATVTLEQDLIRRDLTINAMAEDQEGNIIDPFDGRGDLAKRILRHVSDAFTEDPLRVLRIARFWSRFAALGFTIAPETYTLLKTMVASGELTHLTPERVWKEWEKSLNTSSPAKFLELVVTLDATEQLFDGLHLTQQTVTRLKDVAASVEQTELRFACLFLNQPEHFNLTLFCRRLAIPNRFKEAAQLAMTHQRLIEQSAPLSADSLYQLLGELDYWRRPQRLMQFLLLREAVQQRPQAADDIEHAAHVARQVSAQQLVEQGLRGAEIGQALEQKRRDTFINVLNR